MKTFFEDESVPFKRKNYHQRVAQFLFVFSFTKKPLTLSLLLIVDGIGSTAGINRYGLRGSPCLQDLSIAKKNW